MTQTRGVAEQVNALGAFDAVIHNAAVGYREPRRIETEDGLSHVFAVNTMAPYLLTAWIMRPRRLVYLSSLLHQDGDSTLHDPTWKERPWDGLQAYSDTKLHDALLAFAVERLARCPVECARTWMGENQDGRSAGDGRSGRRPSHPGVTGGWR